MHHPFYGEVGAWVHGTRAGGLCMYGYFGVGVVLGGGREVTECD